MRFIVRFAFFNNVICGLLACKRHPFSLQKAVNYKPKNRSYELKKPLKP